MNADELPMNFRLARRAQRVSPSIIRDRIRQLLELKRAKAELQTPFLTASTPVATGETTANGVKTRLELPCHRQGTRAGPMWKKALFCARTRLCAIFGPSLRPLRKAD
jgi:hypothetical protein